MVYIGRGALRVGVVVVDLRSIFSGTMPGVLVGVIVDYGVNAVHWDGLNN